MREVGLKLKRQINKSLNKLKRFKGLLKRSTIAFILLISILFLKKINLVSTNFIVGLIEENIKTETDFVKGYNFILNKTGDLAFEPDKILNVFNPFKSEKYSPPITGSIYKQYKKGQNDGVDIQSTTGEDPKSIIDGEITKVELVDKKGYFVTIEKENLEITYGYLSKSYMRKGESISKGESIGSLGTNKDGKKYLRIEMKIDGENTNPSEYINLK